MAQRLLLIGDSDALDTLAELSRHIGYDELHRLDDAPAALAADDDVVVAARTPTRARDILRRVLPLGGAGYLGLLASEKESLVCLLKLTAERLPKAQLDRVTNPIASLPPRATPAEQAIVAAAALVTWRLRR